MSGSPGARGALAVLTALTALALPRPGLAQAAPSPHRDFPSDAGVPLGPSVRSLAVPGWGQHTLGQRRAWAYGAAEVVLWLFWADRRDRAIDLRNGYRDLAWTTARLADGPRVDPGWDYYETLTRWARSGAFDRDPATPGVQPEEDPATFNGSIWSLARGLHFGGGSPDPGDPRYGSALAWYRDRAYAEGFLWDWSGRETERARYVELIDESDRRFQQATSVLGAVLANHLLSAVDAFVSVRVPGETRLRVTPPRGPIRASTLHVRWTPPR